MFGGVVSDLFVEEPLLEGLMFGMMFMFFKALGRQILVMLLEGCKIA